MELSRVGLRYARRAPWVLREVTLTLPPGALVEVTGRNGAGKSSLLRAVAGVLPAAAGVVTGRPRVVGWAPERFPAGQPFTVGAYLVAAVHVRGLGDERGRRAVAREVERLALGPLLGTPLPHLSKGSAQKVGLASALLAEPQLLVLDEPWSGLDAGAKAEVPGAVREVLERGGSVVVADHSSQVAALAPAAKWHVADGTAELRAASPWSRAVVEVEVDAADADGLLADLRARGLEPRVR